MPFKFYLLLCIIPSIIFAQSNDLVVLNKKEQEKQEAPKTILEIIVDSSGVDKNIPIDLHRYLIHGSMNTYNAKITFYSNDKVGQLPATLAVPNGKYSFNTNNHKPYGKTSFSVDAEGGYQKWIINPGNHKVAKRHGVLGSLSLLVGTTVGGGLAVLGTVLRSVGNAQRADAVEVINEYNQNLDPYSWETDDYNDAVKKYDKANGRINASTPLMAVGYSTLGVGLTVSIPNLAVSRKNRMKSKLVQELAAAPMKTMEMEGVAQ